MLDKTRNYMQFLDTVLVRGGEDKPLCSDMYGAQSDLFQKHTGASAALYGDLGYIIMIATAGECIKVFPLDVCQGTHLQPLVEQVEVCSVQFPSFDLLCTPIEQHRGVIGVLLQHHNLTR